MSQGIADGDKGGRKAGQMMEDIYTPFYDEEEEETEEFLFHGSGYYDEEGIWHDPEVEEGWEER